MFSQDPQEIHEQKNKNQILCASLTEEMIFLAIQNGVMQSEVHQRIGNRWEAYIHDEKK